MALTLSQIVLWSLLLCCCISRRCERCLVPLSQVPEGIDFLKLNQRAMEKYKLEVAGGLGPTAGKVRSTWAVKHLGMASQLPAG